MSLTLYAHPFSSYCWKVLIALYENATLCTRTPHALYENATPFTFRVVEDAPGWVELESLWPLKKFPVLRDGDATIAESSIIIEYLMNHHPGATNMIPADVDSALRVRFLDRFFDSYVMSPMQTLVVDRMRTPTERDAKGVANAQQLLDVAYSWLEGQLAPRAWVCGDDFSLADCAAAPSLFYADWVHPLG
jgi:glutathione S-transferase